MKCPVEAERENNPKTMNKRLPVGFPAGNFIKGFLHAAANGFGRNDNVYMRKTEKSPVPPKEPDFENTH